MKQGNLFIALEIWFLLSISIPFLRDGLTLDFITILSVLAYFLLSLWWFYKKGQFIKIKNTKRTFILWCTANAMVVEIFHMISKPLHKSLIITLNTPIPDILKNTSIDLILTFPAYLLIFWVMWQLIKRNHYSIFSFFFLMGLGQALGDGNAFFIANPAMLIFIPYVMINYWAMNFVPFLVVKNSLPVPSFQDGPLKKNILPIILLPVTYLIAAAIILTIGGAIGWIPK